MNKPPWDLPAGTWEGDPRAPWNEKEHCSCCPCIEDNFSEENHPDCMCSNEEERDWDAVRDEQRDIKMDREEL